MKVALACISYSTSRGIPRHLEVGVDRRFYPMSVKFPLSNRSGVMYTPVFTEEGRLEYGVGESCNGVAVMAVGGAKRCGQLRTFSSIGYICQIESGVLFSFLIFAYLSAST